MVFVPSVNRLSLTVFAGTLLLFSSCSHSEKSARSLAEADSLQLVYRTSVNPIKSQAGQYVIDAAAFFPQKASLRFTDIVELFRGTEIGKIVNDTLTEYRPSPMNKVASETKMLSGPPGKDVSYIVMTYPKGFKLINSASKLDCPESFQNRAGKGYWHQTCRADFDYKDTGEYIKAYTQTFECIESAKGTTCSYHVEGTMKDIEIPTLARKLFGAKNYSATQAAYNAAENVLHAFYSLAKITEYPKPFKDVAAKAVNDYVASALYDDVRKIGKTYPENHSATNGAFIESAEKVSKIVSP